MNPMILQMPEKVERDESTYTSTYGKFIIQPLERGFGVTLGNSFRRVLLSSIHGAAITHIRFEGIVHEFSTVPGIVENLTEMILNFKQVRVKLINKKTESIKIQLKGPGKFKAANIQDAKPELEILNPDLHIATLNEDVDMEMELRIGRGRGYLPAEENIVSDDPIGTIPIDAIFSPITNVTYSIENTRVGHRTDYEKLILEVNTDGSVTPEDVLTYAGKILSDHINLFISFDVEPEEEEKDSQVDEDILRIRKLLKTSVENLELSVRSNNCLKAANIKTIGDLVEKEESQMLKFRNFGRKSLHELKKILNEKGLHFGMDVQKYLKDE